MADEPAKGSGDSPDLKRRSVLSAGVGTAMAVAGIGAFAGTAAAWKRLDADFKGCSEVWIVVSEAELDYDPPLTVDVVVATNGTAECRSVKITRENATTIPGQYVDAPIVKYRVSGGGKILGVIGNAPSGNPLDCEAIENDHRCTQTPETPSFEDATCYQNRTKCSGQR